MSHNSIDQPPFNSTIAQGPAICVFCKRPMKLRLVTKEKKIWYCPCTDKRSPNRKDRRQRREKK